jgi:hypothetical protein
MPISDANELVRFSLPKELADEIRALQRDLGESPKAGKFFRDRAAGLIQRERQRQADREGLANLARTAAEIRQLRERFDKFLGIFHSYSKLQTETTANTLAAIAGQLGALQQQLADASFAAALDAKGKQ